MAEAENSGGFVNYYLARVDHPQRENQQPYQAECEDIIRALGMNFDEGNIFKEVWRRAAARQGKQKQGHTNIRSSEKLVHYSNALHRLDMISSKVNSHNYYMGSAKFSDVFTLPEDLYPNFDKSFRLGVPRAKSD